MLKGRQILLVEDDELVGASLLQRLELEGARVLWLKQMVRALGAVRTPAGPIDAVICDIGLPDGTGEELFTTLCRTGTPPPFLFITGRGGIEQAVRLLKLGAADYVTKPFDMTVFLERLVLLMQPRTDLQFPPLLGVSPAARTLEEKIERVAADDRSVLIRGGPGTGKDQVARRIHALSDRRAAPFVAVNLIRESSGGAALFGAEGAMARVGEGILLIQAVDRLDADAQHEVRRLLEQGFQGRVIATSEGDLAGAAAAGGFEAELLYRLAQTDIVIPPLRERPEDAVWLIRQFFDRFNGRDGRRLAGVSTLAEEAARSHDWPGGGREARARLLRALQMAAGPMLQPSDLFPERLAEADGIRTLAEARDAAERDQIITALDRTRGQIGEAARLLKISRTTLWEKMQKLGLS